MRAGAPVFGWASMTFEMWIGASCSRMPPPGSAALAPLRTARLVTRTPSTRMRLSRGYTASTRPVFPLSAPVITTTESPFLIRGRCAAAVFFWLISLQHLRCERNDLHVVAVAKLTCDGPEDARTAWLSLSVEQHCRVLVEANVAAVATARLLSRADDDGLRHITLLDVSAGECALDRYDDHIADA